MDSRNGLYKQTATIAGEGIATARVRVDGGTNALAGLVLRRDASNTPA